MLTISEQDDGSEQPTPVVVPTRDAVRGKIREIVHDPEVAEMLSPRNVIGCKRLCVDTGYRETYYRPNVTLIDVSGEPIEAITAASSVCLKRGLGSAIGLSYRSPLPMPCLCYCQVRT